jgi:dihydroxyacid dehydratase/phosphogluconate dehydratase
MKNGDRPHVFRNAVLVLSKCDKIRPGLEGRIMSLIDLSSPNITDYPFE